MLVCTFLHWILLFCTHQRLPFQGPIPPIRGKCPEGTKGVGTLSPKVTERLSQIWYDLSVSAFRRATSPERGGFGFPHRHGFPYEGKLSPQATDEGMQALNICIVVSMVLPDPHPALRATCPYPFCPFGTFPPDRGNRPLRGEPFPLRRVTPQALRASSP